MPTHDCIIKVAYTQDWKGTEYVSAQSCLVTFESKW